RRPPSRPRLPHPLQPRHADARPPQRRAGREAARDRGQVPDPPHARGGGALRRAGRAELSPDRPAVAAALRTVLLDPEAATALEVPGGKDAGVLAPLYVDDRGALHA